MPARIFKIIYCKFYVNACVCVRVCAYECQGAHRVRKRISDPLELALQVVVDYQKWVLE